MDLRFIAIMMAVAILMDMLGRMAKKRAAEQQGPPDEGLDMLEALAEGREPPRPTAGEAPSARRERVAGGFELWSETPAGPGARDPIDPEPVVEPAVPGPMVRDRAARPMVVRSREPRPVEPVPGQRAAVPDHRPAGTVHRVAARRTPPPAPRPPEPQGSAPRPPASRPPSGTGRPHGLGLRTVDGLRNAMVAREVLGPPLALRGEEGKPEGR